MKLAVVWNPEARRPVLCAIVDDELRPVGAERPYSDASTLLAATDGPLGEAVAEAGVSQAQLARYEELEGTSPDPEHAHLLAPVAPAEVWAAGVTYERSRDARMFESGERDIYERVYDAPRPELFFKATGPRVVGPGAAVGLRSDSEWQIPEPELALVLGRGGRIAGYTLGNDMSSRDIEGANPLYLPQAKIFAGSCALGPAVVPAEEIVDPYSLDIVMRIEREGAIEFEGSINTSRLHVTFDSLVEHLARDNWLAPGSVLLTGTGIVPPNDFTLRPEDVVVITCDAIGTLRNRCLPAHELAPPAGWT